MTKTMARVRAATRAWKTFSHREGEPGGDADENPRCIRREYAQRPTDATPTGPPRTAAGYRATARDRLEGLVRTCQLLKERRQRGDSTAMECPAVTVAG